MKKTSPILLVLVIVLGLLVCGLTAYIIYDKTSDKKNDNEIKNNDTDTNKENKNMEEKITSIGDISLVDLKSVSIKVMCSNCDDPEYEKTLVITDLEKIKTLLKNFENYSSKEKLPSEIGFEFTNVVITLTYSNSSFDLLIDEERIVNSNKDWYKYTYNTDVKTAVKNFYNSEK